MYNISNYKAPNSSGKQDILKDGPSKLFIGNPSNKKAEKLLIFSRNQLRIINWLLKGQPPLRKHVYDMRLSHDITEGFTGMKPRQHSISYAIPQPLLAEDRLS